MTTTTTAPPRRPQFPRLFAPLDLGHRRLRNRIVSTAHATGFGEGGLLSEREVAYHARKAMGGAGLIIAFGSASVSPTSSASYGTVNLWDPRNEPRLTRLAQHVHAGGAALLSQATHMGRRGWSDLGEHPLVAPSAIPEPVHREIPHRLRVGEIETIVSDFAAAAARLERCGWDGIEVTSFGGHLLEQFWSPRVNTRRDAYGASFAGRLRFSEEVIGAIAAAVRPDFVVGLRLTGDPLTDATGLSADDMVRIAVALARLGRLDYLSVSGGTGATLAAQAATVPPDSVPEGVYTPLARRIREAAGLPVVLAGGLRRPELAEAVLAEGACDLVAMTRALIADPDLPAKLLRGAVEEVRPCIGINEACIGRLYTGRPITCSVNPRLVEPAPGPIPKAVPRRRVLVVGGGPAGMEAARAAALLGHRVELWERERCLGGQLQLAARMPHRPSLGRFTAWAAHELTRLGVVVRCGRTGDAEAVLAAGAERVVIATGARSVLPPAASALQVRCVTDLELLADAPPAVAGLSVVVYDADGRWRGATAALLAVAGGAARVALVTPLLAPLEDLDPTQKPFLLAELARARVTLRPNRTFAATRSGALRLEEVWSRRTTVVHRVDLVVFAGFRAADDALLERIAELPRHPPCVAAGDCVAPRTLLAAVRDGANAGGRW